MAGNVSEWVGTSTDTPDGTRYFVRGGGYMSTTPESIAVTRRSTIDANPDHTVGFRCAFTP